MTPPYLAGLLAGLVFTAAIGAQNAFVLRQGIRREHLLPVALICSLADVILISAGIAGLGSVLQQHPDFVAFARLAGATFLLAYAAHAARRAWAGQAFSEKNLPRVSLQMAVLSSLGFTFLNPHVYLDTVLILGTLGNQHGPEGRWFFGAGAITASVVWFFSLAYGARRLAPLFRKALAWRLLDALTALTLFLLAVGLLNAGEALG
jgi:L-lysine exporter family protein LysE/ArgO